jgi:hypothetical protein
LIESVKHYHDRGQDDPAVWKIPVTAAVAKIEEGPEWTWNEESGQWEAEF